MVSLLLLAIWILKQATQPLSCAEIVESAYREHLVQAPDPVLEARLDGLINLDIRNEGGLSFLSRLRLEPLRSMLTGQTPTARRVPRANSR